MSNAYNKAMAEQAARRQKLILRLSTKFTCAEIGKKLKISPQRVHQLLQIARSKYVESKV